MRFLSKALALTALATSQGCVVLESLGGSCTQEQITVTWHATITRGTSVTTPLLVTTITPQNVDPSQFQILRQALTSGGTSGIYNVTWTVPAFNVNGGYIALTHASPLASGETHQIASAFNGGGWGAQSVGAPVPPAIAVRADNFTATSASGSISVIESSPLRLRIDVTTSNASGETVRLAGEPGFSYAKVTKSCT
jgi:hypothetical protein